MPKVVLAEDPRPIGLRELAIVWLDLEARVGR
jgi:hypothetical protein